MRNLKKLLAVIVAICVLATFTVPAFAETKSPATVAEELGVIKGTGDGVTADYLATQPDRLQGAIMFLRLKGLEDDAIAFTGTDNFADVAGLNATNKAILAYLKAHPELGFGGIGGDKFGATLKMEAKQYYKVMLNALGYTYGTDDTADFTWATVMSFAAGKGLVKLNDVTKFTVNDLCVGTVEALKATVKGGTETLIAKLVADGNIAADKAASTGLFVGSDVALQVVSATTDNLIVAKIVFNKDLNKDTVNKTNISATGLGTITLGDDNRTVYAKLTNKVSNQDTSVEFTIKDVKDTTGATIAEVKRTVNFKDNASPVISGVTAPNAKTLVIQANEPIQYVNTTMQPLNSIKIDGNVAFGSTTIDYVKNTVTVTLYSAMATGTRKIDVADLVDYAGFKAPAQSFNVDVAEDKTAPVLTSAKMNNSSELEVVFDEALNNVGTFTVAGISTVTPALQSDNKTVKLALSSPLGIGAVVEIKIEYKGQKDIMGNEVKDAVAYTFKVADDTTLPTVTAAIAGENVITLTFSKSMKEAGTIKVVKASDNTLITKYEIPANVTFKADTNKTVIELPAYTERDPLAIKVNITGMSDASIRNNPLAEQNLALSFIDTKDPVVQPLYTTGKDDVTDSKKDYAIIYFDEAMNVDTIKSLSNYIISGSASTNGALSVLSNVSLRSVAADGKSVSFYLDGIDRVGGTYAGAVFNVYGVKDLAGNMKAVSTVNKAGTITFDVVKAEATAKGKIEIEFNANIGTIDYSGITVRKADGSLLYAKTGTISTTKATIELWTELGAAVPSTFSVEFDNAKIKDTYGTTLIASTTNAALEDKIKPTATVEAPTTAGAIKITFDELIEGSVVNTGVTTIGGLAGILTLYKDGVVNLSTTATTVSLLNGTLAAAAGADFDTIVITGLEAGATYSVVVTPVLTDATGYANVINFVNTSVKTN